MLDIQRKLRLKASAERAKICRSFFKTGPGQYGEGDKFIGVSTPDVRRIAKAFHSSAPNQITTLLKSPWHEDRALALVLLTNQYSKARSATERKRIFTFFLNNKRGINNWDLVDISTHKIIGAWTFEQRDTTVLRKLAQSKKHWDRRLAMVATLFWIKQGDVSVTLELAGKSFKDPEDLMHKATGWMLREAGKKSPEIVKDFVLKNGAKMPRTMLRYAIERWPESLRKKTLESTRQ